MVEIFTCTLVATATAFALGWETWQPITDISGYNLFKKEDRKQARKDFRRMAPDLAVCAWPCPPLVIPDERDAQDTGGPRQAR